MGGRTVAKQEKQGENIEKKRKKEIKTSFCLFILTQALGTNEK